MENRNLLAQIFHQLNDKINADIKLFPTESQDRFLLSPKLCLGAGKFSSCFHQNCEPRLYSMGVRFISLIWSKSSSSLINDFDLFSRAEAK
jgi:hypothetical protein